MYLEKNDPYRHVLLELSKGGLNRNVFMVDHNLLPTWRVSDYEQPLPDCFVGVWAVDEPCDFIVGQTFQGFTYHINLLDGELTDRFWTKP